MNRRALESGPTLGRMRTVAVAAALVALALLVGPVWAVGIGAMLWLAGWLLERSAV